MTEEPTAVVPVDASPIVTPAEADRVAEMIRAFDYFKSKVLTKRDVATIQNKPHVKRSGWSKYALACNVSTEVKDERVEERNGSRIYHFTYRAIHLPSGRYAEAVGSASESEKKTWNHPEHDIRTLAQTRAFNRAISNLVGGGEVSAEELQETRRDPDNDDRRRQTTGSPVGVPVERASDDPYPDISSKLDQARLAQDRLQIYPYGKSIHVVPVEELGPDWHAYDEVLAPLGAKWVDAAERWEIQ